jgi:hypothetical protein
MKFLQLILSIFIFLLICMLFIKFSNSLLNLVLLTSLSIFFTKFLVQKYIKNY